MEVDPTTLQALTTVGGVAIATNVVMAVILRAANLGESAQDRWGPLLAVVVAVILAIIATVALGLGGGATIAQAVLTGLFGGATSIGIYSVANQTVAGNVAGNDG